MSDNVIVGLEVVGLGEHGMPPLRMTVDTFDPDDDKMYRWQLVGESYDKHERTLEEVGSVLPFESRELLSEALDDYDRKAGKLMAPIVEWLMARQTGVLHGNEAREMVEEEHHWVEIEWARTSKGVPCALERDEQGFIYIDPEGFAHNFGDQANAIEHLKRDGIWQHFNGEVPLYKLAERGQP